MKAKHIMTPKVVTVSPDALVGDVAGLLLRRRISAVPVVDHGRLAGIVSEADLLHRHEIGTDCALRGEPWWLGWLSAGRSPEEYVTSHARYVRDIMTHDVVTVAPDTPLAEVAAVLEKRRVKRVPVLKGPKLVGIVSRSDLVRALANAAKSAEQAPHLTDKEIEARLLAELRRQPWWREDYVNLAVENGVVTYRGMIDSGASNARMAARVAAENIPGVRGVIDQRIAFQPVWMT